MNSKPTILFVSHDAGRTGAVILLLTLIRWVRANTDFGVATVIARDGPLREEFAAAGPVLLPPDRNWAKLGNRAAKLLRMKPRITAADDRRFARQAAAVRPDLIFSNTITNGDLVDRLGLPGVPVVTFVHELEFWIRNRVDPKALAKVFGHTRRFIAGSKSVRDNLVRNHAVPADKVEVVYEFIPARTEAADETRIRTEAGAVRARLSLPPDAFIVGGGGTGDWRKGFDLFVQLAVAAKRRGFPRPMHFLWTGADEQDGLVPQARHDATHGDALDVLTIAPPVKDADPYFEIYDVFVLSSREDPFPLVCLMAAALAKPVVCFATAGGMPEFVADDAGLVVRYLDIDGLVDAVFRLATDEPLRQKLGARAREKVVQFNDAGVLVPEIVRIIRSQIRGNFAN